MMLNKSIIRRSISVIAAFCLMFSLASAISAATLLDDAAGWKGSKEGFAVRDGKVTVDGSLDPNYEDIVGYKGTTDQNQLIQLRAKLTIPGEWVYFGVRGNEPTQPVWANDKIYAFFVGAEGVVSLAKWQGGSPVADLVQDVASSLTDGNTHDVEYGAINIEGGVKLVFKVDGQAIIEYEDKDNAFTDEGYFSLMVRGNGNKIELSNPEAGGAAEAPEAAGETAAETAAATDDGSSTATNPKTGDTGTPYYVWVVLAAAVFVGVLSVGIIRNRRSGTAG